MHTRLVWGVMLALLPKCGLCLAAYLQLFGLMGVTIVPYFKWLMPVLGVLLCASLTISFFKAKKSGNFTGLVLSVGGGILVLLSKLLLWSAIFTWIGVGLLTISTFLQVGINGQNCNYKTKE